MPENVDINVIAENLVELLTNSTNMASVFYDIFLNPVEMDVTLKQYNDENELVDVTIPNRAKDRRIALSGTGSPEGMITANVGTCYVDSSASTVYFKISGSGSTGWTPALTADSIEDIIAGLQQTIGLDGTEIVLMDTNGTVTSSVDIGDIGADKSLSNLNPTGNGVLAGKASVDLSNLTAMGEAHFANPDLSNLSAAGEAHFANPDLSNLSATGEARINGKADASLSNITEEGKASVFSLSSPNWDYAIEIASGIISTEETFIVPADGFIYIVGMLSGPYQNAYVNLNGTPLVLSPVGNEFNSMVTNTNFPVHENDELVYYAAYVRNDGTTVYDNVMKMYFIPMNELEVITMPQPSTPNAEEEETPENLPASYHYNFHIESTAGVYANGITDIQAYLPNALSTTRQYMYADAAMTDVYRSSYGNWTVNMNQDGTMTVIAVPNSYGSNGVMIVTPSLL